MDIQYILTDEAKDLGLKVTPEYATEGSAAVDLYACVKDRFWIHPKQTIKVSTGLKIWVKDSNYCGIVLPRSGNASRGLVAEGCDIGNRTGLIDSDYQGELCVLLHNNKPYNWGIDSAIEIIPGMRIAQLVIMPVKQANFVLVDEFSGNTERGSGGFGSTG